MGNNAPRFHALLTLVLILLVHAIIRTDGFLPSPTLSRDRSTSLLPRSDSNNKNFFDSFGDFFNRFGGNNENSNNNDEDDDAAGTYRILTIPAKEIKQGGLRLFLMFYLLGMQNTPEPKTWIANQPSDDEYIVDFWFHDQSAILTVELKEDEIRVIRSGSAPSNAYMMQEAVVLQGILDELDQCATDENVEVENRLVVLKENKLDAIKEARETLAFG